MIEIKKVVTQKQIQDMCKIADIVWKQTYSPLMTDEQLTYMIDKFQSVHAVNNQMESMGYMYFILEYNGENAGFVGISPEYREKGDMFLSKLYILEEFRGKGIVKEVFDFIFEETKNKSLSSITLTVNRKNTHAIDVYKHRGFKIVDEVKADIGHGYFMDDYIMTQNMQ